jgi:voltage-gated potassium channel
MKGARIRGRLAARALLLNLAVGLVAVGLNSEPPVREATGPLLPIVLWCCLSVFAFDWVRHVRRAGAHAGTWLRSLSGLIETLSVVAVPIAFLLGAAEPWLAGTLWVLRLIPASPSLGQLGRVLSTERRALSGVGTLFVIVLVLSAAMMHAIEGTGQPTVFGTLPGALWWSVVTLTTTGYGDVVPHAGLGKLVAAWVMMSGLCVFGLLTGILATGFAAESRRQDFLRSWELVRHVPFFASLSQSGIADLARSLRRWDAAENVVVVRRGRRGDSMYFVVSGEVEVEVDPPVRIGPGGFFGEMALLGEGVRTATVTTTRPSTLLVLDIADFRTMMALHPELASAVESAARQRAAWTEAK